MICRSSKKQCPHDPEFTDIAQVWGTEPIKVQTDLTRITSHFPVLPDPLGKILIVIT
jgi:hypothetical protein